jgi:hemolysin activation/secretion protein
MRTDLAYFADFAKRPVSRACAVLCGAFTSLVSAQQAPDAGRLLEQTRPAQPAPAPARPVLPTPAAAPALPPDNTPVAVAGFVFEGNQVFGSEALSALLQDQRGAAVPFGQLRAALARIDALYASQGYFLARAVIARQDLAASGGVLRIQVLEGRLGQLSAKVSPEALAVAERTLAAQGVQTERALQQAPLERALLLLTERLGTNTSAALRPGSRVGSTDLELTQAATGVAEGTAGSPGATEPASAGQWAVLLSADNAGNRYSGTARLLADTSGRNLASVGDFLALRTQLASGLRYAGLSYSLPLGYDGWRLDSSVSQLRYSLCCQFAPLQARGQAAQYSVGLHYPLVLREQRQVSAQLSYSQRHSVDETIAGLSADKRTRPLTLALSINDSSAAQGTWLQNARVQLSRGKLSQAVLPNPNLPSSYGKLRLDYSASLPSLPGASWQVRLAHQAAQTNLDSSEKFSLGGASGVRGWPSGEASGDSGSLASVEWRSRLGGGTGSGTGSGGGALQHWQSVVFADYGQVQQHKNLWANALPAGQPNSYSLRSAGLGVSYSGKGTQVSLQWARGLGRNPAQTAAGLNSDGRHRKSQLWLSTSWVL